jgi:hypothetical protein
MCLTCLNTVAPANHSLERTRPVRRENGTVSGPGRSPQRRWGYTVRGLWAAIYVPPTIQTPTARWPAAPLLREPNSRAALRLGPFSSAL